MSEKPFCTIDIPNIETAAWLRALLSTTSHGIAKFVMEPGGKEAGLIADRFITYMPGGVRSVEFLGRKCPKTSEGVSDIYHAIKAVLVTAGAEKTAPWLPPTAPDEIDGNTVTYSASGVKVGCQSLSLDEMREMVKKCEGEG